MKISTILIVDDEAANRRLARAILQPAGYRWREAGNGEEALASVETQVPDLVLLDVCMPVMDGFAVCQRLKQDPKTKLIPIILLTSLHDLDSKIKGIEAGANDFIAKPLHPAELLARVRSLIALKHYTDELENAETVLKGISGVVEQRDFYTGMHCQHVANYGAAVALSMGLEAADVRAIRLAGLFHDLGKIAIPDQILQKPGPLTTQERHVMETHAARGATLLKPLNTLSTVIPLVRHHHERLDGSGYPDGLSGDEIPLPVRILSVVDIYDALATKRSYKEAYPPEKCLAILAEESARGWWDPVVLEHLTQALA